MEELSYVNSALFDAILSHLAVSIIIHVGCLISKIHAHKLASVNRSVDEVQRSAKISSSELRTSDEVGRVTLDLRK